MTTFETRHHEAMALAEEAAAALRTGQDEEAQRTCQRAFELQRAIATEFAAAEGAEPTRSTYYCSAAGLALNCGAWYEAERLVEEGQSGTPPEAVREELDALYQEVGRWRLEQITRELDTKRDQLMAITRGDKSDFKSWLAQLKPLSDEIEGLAQRARQLAGRYGTPVEGLLEMVQSAAEFSERIRDLGDALGEE